MHDLCQWVLFALVQDDSLSPWRRFLMRNQTLRVMRVKIRFSTVYLCFLCQDLGEDQK